MPSDRLPDPAGLLRRRLLPEVDSTSPEELSTKLSSVARGIAVDHQLAVTDPYVPSGHDCEFPAICLTWQGRPWLAILMRPPGVSAWRIETVEQRIIVAAPVEALIRVELFDGPQGARAVMTLQPGSGRV